ncbi:unnamed protein product [Sympodiomycopsis kandeliae]
MTSQSGLDLPAPETASVQDQQARVDGDHLTQNPAVEFTAPVPSATQSDAQQVGNDLVAAQDTSQLSAPHLAEPGSLSDKQGATSESSHLETSNLQNVEHSTTEISPPGQSIGIDASTGTEALPAESVPDSVDISPTGTIPPAEPVSLDTSILAAPPKTKGGLLDSALSPNSATNTPAKKFTSLNVNKKFLEKASPVLTPGQAARPISSAAKPSGNQTLSQANRLQATSSPSSRLTSAKLSAAGKPQPASWASPVNSAAKAASPMATTLSSGSQTSATSGQTAPTTASTSAASVPAVAPMAGASAPGTSPRLSNLTPAPRLSTALNSAGRAASPHLADSSATNRASRGSPGIRHATLGSLNRSQSPATSSGPTSSAAPWANVKSAPSTKTVASPQFANPDFPTAAEAAAAKKAQEEREKAEAAAAAARHEAHMKQLERFRGTSIGPGRHWDELDDEDGGFLDDVVEFDDGTKYNVPQTHVVDPAKLESQIPASAAAQDDSGQPPITKDQRFKDVDHDRSWPSRSTASSAAIPAATSSAAKQTPTSHTPAPVPTRKPVKETLDIMSGAASIALDEPMASRSPYDMGRSRGDRDSYLRGSRYDRDNGYDTGRDMRSSQQESKGPDTAAVRAWGPLAVRQQSLNPNAAKAETAQPPAASLSSPPSHAVAPQPPAAAPADPSASAESHSSSLAQKGAAAVPASPTLLRRETPREPPHTSFSRNAASPPSGRALPPHLLAQQQKSTEAAYPSVASSPPREQETRIQELPRGIPWARRDSGTKAALTSPVVAPQQSSSPDSGSQQQGQQRQSPTVGKEQQQQSKPQAADQASEMLSAAERARRRRQEEEAAREAEKQRAKQKALAIEEKMRKAAEEKEAAEQAAKQRAEEERQQEEQARIAAEKAKKEEEEAAALKRANVWRPKNVTILESQKASNRDRQSPERTASSTARSPSTNPPVHSISDEATSWRRSRPLPTSSALPAVDASKEPSQTSFLAASPPPAHASSPPRQSRRSAGSLSSNALDSMANLDDVIDRIRGAMQDGGRSLVAGQSESKSPQPPTPHLTGPPRLLVNPDRVNKASAVSPPQAQGQTLPERPAGNPSSEVTLSPKQRGDHPARSLNQRQPSQQQTQQSDQQHRVKRDASAPQPQSAAKPAPVQSVRRAVQEPVTTRDELVADDKPAWNRFKVVIKPSAKRQRLLKHHYGNQKARVNAFAASEAFPQPSPYILTWDPPIPTLPMKTLNRDDQFFSKKFRKGKVITHVSLPSTRLASAPPANLKIRDKDKAQMPLPTAQQADTGSVDTAVQVRLPGSTAKMNSKGLSAAAAEIATSSSYGVPTAPASMRARENNATSNSKTAQNAIQGASSPFEFGVPTTCDGRSIAARSPNTLDHLAATRPELDFGKGRRNSAATNGVAFAHNAPVGDFGQFGRDANTPSPVSFMVNSELENLPRTMRNDRSHAGDASIGGSSALSGVPVSPLPNAAASAAVARSASHTPLLPSTTLGSSTWGQGPLSFLDTPKSNTSGGADAGHIKDVWSRPDGKVSGSNTLTPTQNSLRDIGDDFLPSTLSMSLNDLKVDDSNIGSSEQHMQHQSGRVGRGFGRDGRFGGPSTSSTSTSAFRASPSGVDGRLAASERPTAPHLSMANHSQSKLAQGPSGHGSNSAPSTSPNLLRSQSNLGANAALGDQRGASSLYPSAYIDAAADPFTPASQSSNTYQYGAAGDQGQHALYSSLGPVETGGFGTEDNYGRSHYGSGAYGTWSDESSAGANAYDTYSSATPTSSRMPFANNRQHAAVNGQSQPHQQARNPYAYGSSSAYGSSYSGNGQSRNSFYGSGAGGSQGTQYRSYPSQHEYGGSSGASNNRAHASGASGSLGASAYGATRESSLASALGGTRGGLAPHQQQPPHFARYNQAQSGYGGGSSYQRSGSSNLSSPFTSKQQHHGGAYSGHNLGHTPRHYNSDEHSHEHRSASSQQQSPASLWQQ